MNPSFYVFLYLFANFMIFISVYCYDQMNLYEGSDEGKKKVWLLPFGIPILLMELFNAKKETKEDIR